MLGLSSIQVCVGMVQQIYKWKGIKGSNKIVEICISITHFGSALAVTRVYTRKNTCGKKYFTRQKVKGKTKRIIIFIVSTWS